MRAISVNVRDNLRIHLVQKSNSHRINRVSINELMWMSNIEFECTLWFFKMSCCLPMVFLIQYGRKIKTRLLKASQ